MTPRTNGDASRVVLVRPEPSPEVLAAVLAAVGELSLCPPVLEEESRREGWMWRFSGRWWAKPTVLRRDRPRTTR
ncbi:MAG: hypothetical protein ABSH04_04525 [Acidimicrobiales bacterium]